MSVLVEGKPLRTSQQRSWTPFEFMHGAARSIQESWDEFEVVSLPGAMGLSENRRRLFDISFSFTTQWAIRCSWTAPYARVIPHQRPLGKWNLIESHWYQLFPKAHFWFKPKEASECNHPEKPDICSAIFMQDLQSWAQIPVHLEPLQWVRL